MGDLGHNSLLNSLIRRPRTALGKSLMADIAPFTSAFRLKEELDRLKEAMDYLSLYNPSFPESPDFRAVIAGLKKGRGIEPLTARQFLSDSNFLFSLKKQIDSLEGYFSLKESLSGLKQPKGLLGQIERSFGEDGRILDGASASLLAIRRRRSELEGSLLGLARATALRYSQYLTFKEPLYRDGRYVLGVNVSYKNKIDGLVVSYSGSGETAYVLPRSNIEATGELERVKGIEKNEEAKVVSSLTRRILSEESDVSYIEDTLGYFDFLFAKARYGVEEEGSVPALSAGKGHIELYGLRHPSLSKERAVLNDFKLSEEKRAMVISGPNAGGKSVALKSVGLAAICFSEGLPVLCQEGSSLSLFPHVYFSFGDNQSIENSLSTFAANMEEYGRFIEKAGEGDLVLIDELGMGTSPREGEAIAIAVVSSLLRKRCIVMVSSHFEGLKAYAMETEGAFNASMGYKEGSLTPSYKLRLGLPGKSYSLEAALKYGLPKETVEEAEKIVAGQAGFSLEDSLTKLEREIAEAEKSKEEAEKLRAEEERKSEELDKKLEALRKSRGSILEKAEQYKRKLIDEAKERIREIASSLGKAVKPHEITAAKAELDALEEDDEKQDDGKVEDLGVNDFVSVKDLGIKGTLVSLNGRKAVVQGKDGFTYKVDAGRLSKENRPVQKTLKTPFMSVDPALRKPTGKLEINLIGLHLDEAKATLSGYLDSCRVSGIKRVRIIHGLGSGVLRNMVAEYLKSHPEFVAGFETAGEREGGLGATIAHLR